LFGQLTAGAGKRLTAVAGSAGAGFALGQDRPRVSLAEDQHLAGHLGPGCEHEGRRTTGQDQPAAEPNEDQMEQVKDEADHRVLRLTLAHCRGSQARQSAGTPQPADRTVLGFGHALAAPA
jgi:hypothetical protein